ncbi:TetR/AcrR family transcriptional regulator [Pedobacter sp. MC2016-05]|uniref:TetR/AcrR family transcriptional regulator n=1 Tax=Pedobacter sp. MC2016-05 TaxID=2994474 RepID=UPI0022474C1E|nr:TetR/AcrR family transcriptional regulator [Pedobacter sp. MC2016-05]MCX2475340.1 TetR/AcrR family transcriptional regulator [Pedobacter sp. MC2016-05]
MDKKVEIMEAAEKLFAEHGYAETTIRQITSRISKSSAMIGYYFGSKESLVEAIINYRTTKLEQLIDHQSLKINNPLKCLYEVLARFVDKAFQQPYFYMLLNQLQSVGKEKLLIESFNTLKLNNYNFMEKIIIQGQLEGYFKRNSDINMLIAIISGTINHVLINKDYLLSCFLLGGGIAENYNACMKKRLKSTLENVITAHLCL